jgi:hypothetical protein
MKRIVGWLLMTCLMAACGDPDQGPPLGPFAAMAKKETDPAFNIVPPSSRSPAAFSYTSSNLAVATIAGSLVTIKGPGKTTITASQPSIGNYGPTSASTTLTVDKVDCGAGSAVVNGVCTVVPVCVKPAVLTNNQCVPPATGAALVHANGLAWLGVSYPDNWTNAENFCATITIQGAGKWRQPSSAELTALQASGVLAGQGWTLGPTWSSTMASASATASHVVVDLSTGATADRPDVAGAYVSCVR